MFSNLCIFNIFKNSELFNKFFTIFNNLLLASKGILDDQVSTQCYINVREDALSVLSIEPIDYKDSKRSQTEVKHSKKLFLKSIYEENIEVHHIIEWNYIFKNRDITISEKELADAVDLLNLSEEFKNKYLSDVKTISDLIDNRYNLIPISKDLHREKIDKKTAADPIRELSGIELNLYMEMELIDNKLYLKHLFNPNDKILLEDLNKRKSKLKMDNIQDLLNYNKIIRKILKVDEFKERYKYAYIDICKNKTKKLNKYKNKNI